MTIAVRPASSRSSACLDHPLGAHVDVRRRLVEDQDPRLGEQRPREGDDLALAGRQRARRARRPRSRSRRAAGRRTRRRRPRRPAAVDLLVARVGAPEGDVLADRAREQEALLRHDPELAAQRLRARRSRRSWPSTSTPAALRVVEARDELRERRLAGAGLADQRHRLPGGHVQVDALAAPSPASAAELVGRRRRRRARRRTRRRRARSRPAAAPGRSRPARRPCRARVSSRSKILSSAAMPCW